jgi:dipeptidyl aminopeptidase/acylaminoacyl peptidase
MINMSSSWWPMRASRWKRWSAGVADPYRIAIGGHCYGAEMVANLLVWSDLFRAGIAMSGAYNRTLTPFGFQTERRTLWDAPKNYLEMSPFLHADRINEPLLLTHGADDPKSGTIPLQGEMLFDAIRELGGTARYVLLPC